MAQTAQNNPNPAKAGAATDEIDALILKHRREIDPVLRLDTEPQKQSLRDLGVNPDAFMEHHKDLQTQSQALNQREEIATRKASRTGWIAFAATLITTGALALKGKIHPTSSLVRGFVVAFTSMFAGLVGTFTGSKIFSGQIRKESQQLDAQARYVLERELAVAMENRDREQQQQKHQQDVHSAEELLASERGHAAKAPQRDASFATQATTDKAATGSHTLS